MGFRKIDWDNIKIEGKEFPFNYCGLIGAQSNLSSGKGSPEEFIREAKRAGYDFIAFTEDIKKLTPEKFLKLKEICKKYSDDKFRAFPGFLYQDESGNWWITFANRLKWPEKGWWSKKYPGRIKVNNPLTRGFYWPPVILIKPHLNPEKPWFQGNFKGFSIYTYENGKLVDDALDYYLRLEKEFFNLFPIAVHIVKSPGKISKEKNIGFQTYIRWFNLNVDNALSSTYGATYKGSHYWHWPSFVSEGPIIEDARVLNFGTSDLAIEGNDRFRIHFKVSSPSGLKEVKILDADAKNVWRRFLPEGKKVFEKAIDGFHKKQYEFVLLITDKNNKNAVGWCNWTSVQENNFSRCSDNFNTMPGGKCFAFSRGISNPRGFECHLFSRSFPYCLPSFPGMEEFSRPAVEFYPVLASRFVNITDCIIKYHYPVTASANFNKTDTPERAEENKYVEGKVRHILFTPFNDSTLFQYVKGKFKVKNSFNLKGSITIYRSPAKKGADIFCATVENGNFVCGKITEKTPHYKGKLPLYGYAAILPQPFTGSAGVITLQKGTEYFAFGRGYSYLMLKKNYGKKLKAGEEINYQFITAVSKLDPQTDNSFISEAGRKLGIGQNPSYTLKLSNGSVIEKCFVLKLKAENFYVSGKISQAGLPLKLLVEINGLNPNWDAGIWYKGTNTLIIPEWKVDKAGNRYVENVPRKGKNQIFHIPVMEDGTGFLQIDTFIGGKEFFIGNFLVSNNREVKITLTDLKKGKSRFVIHNPTDKKNNLLGKTK